jgi:ubiquinone/menaquinone biosynthesis C-methylase UbiE
MSIESGLDKVVSLVAQYQDILKSQRDRDFLHRVYADGLQFYLNRLKAIDFTGANHVLDAGCGFGQWTLGLSLLNVEVTGIDSDESRIQISEKISQKLNRNNITFLVGTIEELPHANDTFDAIFCYSTIYQTDYHRSLQEFYRVLKKKGAVYISTNDWGWYIYNLITNHNPSDDFNPRQYAGKSIFSTIRHFVTKRYSSDTDLVMPSRITIALMKKSGFKNVSVAAEGCLVRNNLYQPKPVYPSKYFGLRNVYEVIGEK